MRVLPVKMVQAVVSHLWESFVIVNLALLGTYVKPILMSVNQILVRMVDFAKMESIPISVHVKRDSMGATVSYNCYKCKLLLHYIH